MNTISKQRGFTLIELLVVISIIGMLASVILASLNGARAKGIEAASKTFDTHVFQAFGADAYAIFNFDDGQSPPTDSSANGFVMSDCAAYGTTATTTSGIIGKGWALSPSKICRNTNLSSSAQFDTSKGSISIWILQPASIAGGNIVNVRNIWLQEDGSTGKFMFASVLGRTPLTLSQWNHVLVTWGNGTLRYYINGKLDYDNSWSPSFSSYILYLGSFGSGGAGVAIDQFAIYTQSMQTAQVEQLYASQLPRHTLAMTTK